jgi:DNA-binding transcriptional MerR regulator
MDENRESIRASAARVSTGQLCQRSGMPARALKHWIDVGVLQPTRDTRHAGKGNHRVFFVEEVIVAALLAPLADASITLGHLLRFARIFRRALRQRRGTPVDGLDQRYQALGQAVLRATQGVGDNFLALTVTITDHIHFDVFDGLFDAKTFFADAGSQPAGAIVLVDMTDRLHGILTVK